MSDTLKYFMWGYQPHFQAGIEGAAERLFSSLDSSLTAQAFLVGFLVEKKTGFEKICIEPEDCSYEPSDFNRVEQLSATIWEADEERHIFHTLPEAQKSHDERVRISAMRSAVEQAVREFDDQSGLVSFCSWPAIVADYQVFVILQLPMPAYDKHYKLSIETIDGRHKVAKSLLGATIHEFLDVCTRGLSVSQPGRGLRSIERDSDELLRAAGRSFAYRVAMAGGVWGTAGSFYENCNAISAAYYERNESKGSIIVAEANHPNVKVEVRLKAQVPLSLHRAVRKLIEISAQGTSLLSDAYAVYGFGSVVGNYDATREDLFEIDFTDHFGWNLLHDRKLLMRVAYGQPRLSEAKFDLLKLSGDLTRIFLGISQEACDRICAIVLEASRMRRGTQIVICGDAASEAERLAAQATAVVPIQLTPELLRKLSAIDGALMIDPEGNCHAVGVILDGVASDHGDPARGSRYNSAIRYSQGRDNCLVVVVSDDETVDFVPTLRPQVSRPKLDYALQLFAELAMQEDEDTKAYNRVMGWLRAHQFYLSKEQCDEVNKQRKTHEASRKSEVGRMWLVYDDLKPNADMNDSYFCD
jgi:hypothetical protein